MEMRVLVFDNDEEKEAFKNMVLEATGRIIKEYFQGRIKDLQEYHQQIERHKQQAMKDLEEYTATLIKRIMEAKNDEKPQ